MSRAPSSTTLRMWHRHCAAAALRQLAGEETDRRPYGVGVAAHACLEAMAGDRKNPLGAARKAAAPLMLGERVYKGVKEPPYSPDHVAEGLRLATTWLEEVGAPRGDAEVGVAVDAEWHIVDYDSAGVWYSQVLDLVRVYEDEDDDGEPVKVLRIEDYKTSPAVRDSEIDSLQMRGAGCLGVALAEQSGCSIVELQVAAVRRLRWCPKEPRRLHFRRADTAYELAERWRPEIDRAVKAILGLRDRGRDPDSVANPGAGCVDCPYRDRCQPSRDAHQALGAEDPAESARAWLATRAQADLKEKELRLHTQTHGSIPLGESKELAHYEQAAAELAGDAVPTLAASLGWSPEQESLAQNLGLTTGNVRALIKELRRREGADHDALRQLERATIKTGRRMRWGVRSSIEVELDATTEKFTIPDDE